MADMSWAVVIAIEIQVSDPAPDKHASALWRRSVLLHGNTRGHRQVLPPDNFALLRLFYSDECNLDRHPVALNMDLHSTNWALREPWPEYRTCPETR